jgi:predicted RND superfamily exporter protein
MWYSHPFGTKRMSMHPSEPAPLPMSEPPPSRKAATAMIGKWMDRLSDIQVDRPYVPLAIVLAISLAFALLATRLELRTRFDQLLPESQPSVIELKRVEKRANVAQTTMVLLESDDHETMRALGDAIVPKLNALGPDVVSSAEDGIQEARAYLQPRAGLFVDKEDLQKAKDEVDARWDWEVSHTIGTALDDDAADAPPPIDKDTLQKRFEGKAKEKLRGRKVDKYKDGYYESQDGKALVVVARSPVAAGDLDGTRAAVDKMYAAVREAQASKPEFSKVRVSYAGDMVTGLFEYGAIRTDLLNVGAMGISFVLTVVVLYFMRFRALLVMGITIACGLAWTFGMTEIAIGHLNIATGFLVSIVAGNGINVGIIWLSRYYEEKRKGATTPSAIHIAHRTTWPSTVVAAIAAAASYSSLGVTDSKAFKHFAFIGATGMIFCWIVTVTLLPTLLRLIDKDQIARNNESGLFARLRAGGVPYGKFFAAIVPKIPRFAVAVGVIMALVGSVLTVRYINGDPMEYDLGKIQNDKSQRVELNRTWDVVNSILGQFPGAMVVLTETPEQADELTQILQKRWDDAPENAKPFEAVHSIYQFIPKDQPAKIDILVPLAERLRRAHEREMISDADWKDIQTYLPPDDLKPFGIADLPDNMARPFTERNGTRGTLVLIEPSATQSTDDLHYLIRYSDSFRETKLQDGTVLRGSGRAVIFADILSGVVSDIPKAVSLSLAMTLLAVFLTFRRGSQAASVLATLVVGLAGVITFMYVTKVRINFMNFAALPITFGIGVDYGVNVMQRYHADGSTNILGALRTTGGAVVLCSLTTTLGYFALLGSHNQAIRSLGIVAVVGEISCLLAAMIVLPSGWYLAERRRGPSLEAPRVPKI